MVLVPIKVKITRKYNGHCLYPDFNRISSEIRHGLDWSIYFDTYGICWHYDHLSGFGFGDREENKNHPHYNNDPSVFYGATCVPADFAEAAVALFPGIVEIITEESFEAFYNDRCHYRDKEKLVDEDAILEMQADIAVNKDLDPQTILKHKKMLDPSDPTRGVRWNWKKRWETFKIEKGIKIRDKESKK